MSLTYRTAPSQRLNVTPPACMLREATLWLPLATIVHGSRPGSFTQKSFGRSASLLLGCTRVISEEASHSSLQSQARYSFDNVAGLSISIIIRVLPVPSRISLSFAP